MDWFSERTWTQPDWSIADLQAAKLNRKVSVVLPALNEEATVGEVVATVTPLLGGLVDELVVMDSGSTDRTVECATRAGARVVYRQDVLPHVPVRTGKGEVLWRSLAATTGDIVVFMDSDLLHPDPMFVPNLLGPLLTVDGVHLVKGFFHRMGGGGRVTELVARPLLSALVPELGEMIQPLSGQCAASRELLTAIPFAPGYGVEIGMLVDSYHRCGMDGLAQVNLGVLTHDSQELSSLSLMSRQVIDALLARCGMPSQDELVVRDRDRVPMSSLTTPTAVG